MVGWAYVVLGQAVRMDWRRGIKEMVAANSVVAVLLALGAALHPGRGASALMAFIALDVISIAVAQTLALLRRDEHQAQPRSTPPRRRSSPAGRAPARDLRTV